MCLFVLWLCIVYMLHIYLLHSVFHPYFKSVIFIYLPIVKWYGFSVQSKAFSATDHFGLQRLVQLRFNVPQRSKIGSHDSLSVQMDRGHRTIGTLHKVRIYFLFFGSNVKRHNIKSTQFQFSISSLCDKIFICTYSDSEQQQ